MQTRERAHCARSVFPFIKKKNPWDNPDMYTFLPFPLVGKVVARVRETPNLSMTGRCPLAGGEVVCRPAISTDPTTFGASVVGLVVAAAPLQQVPPWRPHTEPSLVATLQCLLRKSGFSRGSAIEMSSCILTSISCLSYQAIVRFGG